jgi:predicted AAA+ superfamily ATPase
MKLIPRTRHLTHLLALLRRNPVVGVVGARQVGKTTLARQVGERFEGPVRRFDLEDPDDLARLSEPRLALGDLRGLVIVDEVQRRPDLFPVLRVLADRPGLPARFLILGSASPDLLQQSAESLAGRIGYHEVGGYGLDEVAKTGAAPERLWVRGGFPRSYLARTEADSFEWRRAFVRTFLERDLAQLGIRIPGATMHRFWRMLAYYHAQVWNGAELARAFGVAGTTVRRYLDVLTGALVLRQLPPWHENVGKRQVKAPKVYVADAGLLHALLGLATRDDLEGHPKVGASWEGFVVSEVLARLGAAPDEAFFWASHAGAELDLLVVRGRRRMGFEVKRTTAPAVTRSMRAARETLRLARVDVIHGGRETFPLEEGFRAVALADLLDAIEPF